MSTINRPLRITGAALLCAGVLAAALLPLLGRALSTHPPDDHRVPADVASDITLTAVGRYRVYLEVPGHLQPASPGPDTVVVVGADDRPLALSVPSGKSAYTSDGRAGRKIAEFTTQRTGRHRVLANAQQGGDLLITRRDVVLERLPKMFGLFGGGSLAVVGAALLLVGLVRRRP